MFIDIHELEIQPIVFKEDFRPDTIDLGADVRQRTDLHTQGRAELIEEHTGGRGASIADIRIVASLSTQVEVACARCLDPVIHDVARSFDLLYRPQGADTGPDEISVTQAEADIGYYTGDGLQLEDVLREQVLLAVPIKSVCSDACKGLCPYCGRNLNREGECGCKQEIVDPRWDALKDLRDKLKS